MLAVLYNVFNDDRGLAQFSIANNDEHVRINKAILAQYEVEMPTYILDPISLNNPSIWLYTHQNVHNLMNAVLGIAGNDLSDVDFKDKSQVASWIWLHAQEHYQAAEKLGLR